MEEERLATELLHELKAQSKRWFIAFCIMVGVEVLTIIGQELTHADYLLAIATEAMSNIAWIPESDKEAFDKCQKRSMEKAAMVKLMLSR